MKAVDGLAIQLLQCVFFDSRLLIIIFYFIFKVRLIKELYGNQIGELFHSLPYNVIEFVLEDFEW